jgi:hypothetical protein
MVLAPFPPGGVIGYVFKKKCLTLVTLSFVLIGIGIALNFSCDVKKVYIMLVKRYTNRKRVYISLLTFFKQIKKCSTVPESRKGGIDEKKEDYIDYYFNAFYGFIW